MGGLLRVSRRKTARCSQGPINSGDAAATTRIVRTISTAIVTHSYRTNVEDWESEEDTVGNLADRLPLSGEPQNSTSAVF